MAALTKAQLQERLLKVVENLPTQEESGPLGFNLDVIDSGQQLLSNEAKKKLLAHIRSARTTKKQLRRAFILLSGLAKIAIMFA